MFLKAKGEIEGGRKTDMVGDLGQRLVGVGQKMARLNQPLCFEILPGRLAHLPAKERGKTGPRKAKPPGDGFQALPLSQVPGQIVGSLLDARVLTRIFFPRIGAAAEEESPFDRVGGKKFAPGRMGAQNGVGQGEFLENGPAQFAWEKEMF
jgi:hypothetical protein